MIEGGKLFIMDDFDLPCKVYAEIVPTPLPPEGVADAEEFDSEEDDPVEWWREGWVVTQKPPLTLEEARNARPMRMRGVIEGGHVFVTDDIDLPMHCMIYVQIIPAVLGAYDLRHPSEETREEVAELEAFFSEMHGHPVDLWWGDVPE